MQVIYKIHIMVYNVFGYIIGYFKVAKILKDSINITSFQIYSAINYNETCFIISFSTNNAKDVL